MGTSETATLVVSGVAPRLFTLLVSEALRPARLVRLSSSFWGRGVRTGPAFLPPPTMTFCPLRMSP